jgi:hypothetical protein
LTASSAFWLISQKLGAIPFSMDERQAEWRAYLKEDERAEWEAQREARDRFRDLNRKLKARCMARMMREARRVKN